MYDANDFDLSRTEWENLIDEWIVGNYAERNRAILKDRLLDGVLFEKLAEKYDLSVQHTRDIVAKNKRKLFRHVIRR